jgi:protein SCO1/2
LSFEARRRDLLVLLLGAAASRRAWAHEPIGPVTPSPAAPDIALTLHDGRRIALTAVLSGKTTVLQLMFTGCSATCPIQGAVFAALERRLAAAPAHVQLLSISIDALADDANALAAWRGRFGASPRWLAGVPPPSQVDRLLDFVRGRAPRDDDRHTANAYLLDARARLVYRYAEFAAADDIAAVVAALPTQR